MNLRLRRKRAKLMLEQDGKCCYCGIRMRLIALQPGDVPPPDQCTIEHTYPKGHPLRGSANSLKLACFRCNNERGIAYGRECDESGRSLSVGLLRRVGSALRWLGTQ